MYKRHNNVDKAQLLCHVQVNFYEKLNTCSSMKYIQFLSQYVTIYILIFKAILILF